MARKKGYYADSSRVDRLLNQDRETSSSILADLAESRRDEQQRAEQSRLHAQETARVLNKGRARLAELRQARAMLEEERKDQDLSGDESSTPQRETKAVSHNLVQVAMSQAEVHAYVHRKRAEFAAKHKGKQVYSSDTKRRRVESDSVELRGIQADDRAISHGEENSDDEDDSSSDGNTADDDDPDFDPKSAASSPDISTTSDDDGDNNVAAYHPSTDAIHTFGVLRKYDGVTDGNEASRDSTQIVIPEPIQQAEDDAVDMASPRPLNSDDCRAFLSGFPCRWLSWGSFHDELKRFEAQTNQRFIIRSSQRIQKRNAQMKDSAIHFPERRDYYCKTLVCTHGHKQPSRGSGARRHDSVRYSGCEAKINVTLSQLNGQYYLFVRPKNSHNHEMTPELWKYYAENRQIIDPALIATANDMHVRGAPVKGILGLLRSKSKRKTKLKDVHNLLREASRAAKGASTDVERTEAILTEFKDKENGNVARIFVDKARHVALVVVFQTVGMRRLFAAFPEVLLVDTTHNTNVNAYKLFSFVVHDCFGKGQYVQHALVERETKDNLRLALRAFQESNPDYKRVKVVMTDKAFHEKDVLAEVFTNARQLLCKFHVLQWFGRQVAKLVVGNASEKAAVEASLTQLIDATSAEAYDAQKLLFLDLLGGDKDHPLYVSFLDDWDNMQDEWVMYRRGNVPHLGNNTNNRLESKWGKLKQLITPSYGIDDVVASLITIQDWTEDEYIEEYNRVGSRPHVLGEDPELSGLAVTITSYAFSLVKEEFTCCGRLHHVRH